MASNDGTAQFEGECTEETNPVVSTSNADDHHGENHGNERVTLKKGPWAADEDAILIEYVVKHGEGNWNAVRKVTGLPRCGKSCRLRWANHLRPNLKKGAFSPDEEQLILQLHAQYGNKWAKMASLLPGRTDNEIKNYWNTRIKRRQRQGLPLYSNEPQHRYATSSTTPPSLRSLPLTAPAFHFHTQHRHFPLSPSTPTPLMAPITPTTPTGSSPAFQFHAQHHHFPPISPSSNPHSPLTPQHPTTPTCNFTSPSSTFKSSSFNFQRPTPLLSTRTLQFKRVRSSNGNYSLPPLTSPLNHQPATTRMPSIGGFQFHKSSSEMLKTQVDSSEHVAISPTSIYQPKNLELPSNQFSKYRQPDQISFDTNNNVNENTSAQINHGDQIIESLINFKKEESSLFDECSDLDEFSSFFWPNSTLELKMKEETSYFSKAMEDDLSKLLTGVPSSKEVSDWIGEWEGSNGQPSILTSGVTVDGDMMRTSNSMNSLESDASPNNHNHRDDTPANCLHKEQLACEEALLMPCLHYR